MIRENHKELNNRGPEADEESLLKWAVLSEGEQKKDPPDASPNKAGVEPRWSEVRSEFDSQFGREPGSPKEPEQGAVHKGTKTAGCEDQTKLLQEILHGQLSSC